MAKHPHHDLIVAWAADTSRVVQARLDAEDRWEDCEDGPCWLEEYEYRFKPEPKPDVVRYATATNMVNIKGDKTVTFVEHITDYPIKCTNLKLTFDGETGKLKVAEVIE